MWDAFLDRTCHSCVGFQGRTPFGKKKNDLCSVEYSSYIHKDILSCLEVPMKNSQRTPRKGTPRSSQTYYEKYNNNRKKEEKTLPFPIYFKADVNAISDTRPAHPPYCSSGQKCTCPKIRGKHVGPPERNVVVLSVAECSNAAGSTKLKICEAIEGKKMEKTPFAERMQVKEVKFPYLFWDRMLKKCEGERVPPPPPPPPPVLKLRKKGDVLEYRSLSKPLYTTGLKSRINILKWKMFKFGEKGSGIKAKTDELQDFEALRLKCLRKGILFEDKEFPAEDSSLFISEKPDFNYEWKRPHEIVENPEFFVGGFSRFDLNQGALGNCWFLAAAANLTLYKNLFLQIVPDDQGFGETYAGIFHFRFWRYGRWVDVVVDDRLPTLNKELVYLHSSEDNEFWSPLFEKAFAKLHGSYENLTSGDPAEAMENFTGGIAEIYRLEEAPPDFFDILLKASERSSFIGCWIDVPASGDPEKPTPQGLIRGHAYSITKVKNIKIETPFMTTLIPILRLRNPWGNQSEWTGAWSDCSPEWLFISEEEKDALGLVFEADGEFWMEYEDFIKNFSHVELCNFDPEPLAISKGVKKKWYMSIFEGEWVHKVTAGGRRKFEDTYWLNPQYRITLNQVDENDEDEGTTIIVALMQKSRHPNVNVTDNLLLIGFSIYFLEDLLSVPKPLDKDYFMSNKPFASSSGYSNLREVTGRFKLPCGTYCIVPTTFDPNGQGGFLLRVFSENQSLMEEHDDTIGYCEANNEQSNIEIIPKTEPKRKLSKKVADREVETTTENTDLESARNSFECAINTFKTLSAAGGEIDWLDLKEIVDEHFHISASPYEFSKENCRSMIAMLDEDRSGKICLEEFNKLLSILHNWKNAWILHDIDESGTFDGSELRSALNDAGYKLNTRLLNVIMHRYGNKAGEITFDDFLTCAIKLKIMIDIFKAHEENDSNIAAFTMADWLEYNLYS